MLKPLLGLKSKYKIKSSYIYLAQIKPQLSYSDGLDQKLVQQPYAIFASSRYLKSILMSVYQQLQIQFYKRI